MHARRALPFIVALSVAWPALAAPSPPPDVLDFPGLGYAIGRLDYCGGGGQAIYDTVAGDLRRLRQTRDDAQALLAVIQEHRTAAREEASRDYGGRPCPLSARSKAPRLRADLVAAWRRIVREAPNLDLRSGVDYALGRSSAPRPMAIRPPVSPPAPPTVLGPPPQTSGGAAPSALCVKGLRVSVRSAGAWYPAQVLDGPDRMGTCLVSYDNFPSHYDEWVSAERMRPAADQAASAPAANPGPANGSQPAPATRVPPGKYQCYTFDNGALNYAFTDVQILDASRYAVGAASGTYTLSGSRMKFTGTLSNATGTFTVKSTGKPQIDLVFNGDARASMACTRAG